MLRPQFMGNRARNFAEIQEHADVLVGSIPQGRALDLQPLFYRYTIDTTTFLLFGKSIRLLTAQGATSKETLFADALNRAQDYMAQRARLGPLYWTVRSRKMRETCAVVHEFIDDTVQNAIKERLELKMSKEQGSHVFINALLDETQDPKYIRNQLLHILLAGRDTTASCLSWTV